MKKGLLRLSMFFVYIFILAAVVLRFMYFSASAEVGSETAQETVYEAEDSEEWYALSRDGKEITFSLPVTRTGYLWKYGISNDNILEQGRRGVNEGRYSITFRASGSREGSVKLVFSYIRYVDEPVRDSRSIALRVNADGQIEVEEADAGIF